MPEAASQQPSEETFVAGREAGVIPMLPVMPHARASATRGKRWGVILAGGDGTRLQRLTRLICGDDRPKQFCPLGRQRHLAGADEKKGGTEYPPGTDLISLNEEPSRLLSSGAGDPPVAANCTAGEQRHRTADVV